MTSSRSSIEGDFNESVLLGESFHTPDLILMLISRLPTIAAKQINALIALHALFPEDHPVKYREYTQKYLTPYIISKLLVSCVDVSYIARVESLKEEATWFNDTKSAITRHGEKIATRLLPAIGQTSREIGDSVYTGFTIGDITCFQRDRPKASDHALFNWWQNPPEGTQLADWGDYARLITDVEVQRLRISLDI